MLHFFDRDQQYPDIEAAVKRRLHFKEIYAPFSPERAAEQAERCSQCGIPFCQVHCPLQNNIPDWLKLTAEGRLKEAYQMSAATNTFPEICGRICPQDKLCEGNCVVEKDFGAITIGAVEKYLTENAFSQGWVEPIRVGRDTGQSVGIIGAGPAGIAAAEKLRRAGHRVVVYDAYDRAGGLLIYGIPNFKLDKSVVARRMEWLKEAGIEFVLNTRVGEQMAFEDLRVQHDAVLIATGVYQARALEVPNATLEHIVPAMAYLTASNRHGLGDRVEAFESGALNAKGREVVVIGGGDTAMDCVRTAVRQGAKKVTCLYRRDRANMPGSAKEVKHAEEEGVIFEWLAAPAAFLGDRKVEGVMVQRMRLMPADNSGRQQVAPVKGETLSIKADMVIQALGFDAEDLPALFKQPSLQVTSQGTIKVDAKTMQTSLPGVFAAGDIVRGASLVVWAIRDGRDVAAAIQRSLTEGAKRRVA